MKNGTGSLLTGTYSEFDMHLLCWGSGELGQTGHGRPGDVSPEEAHLREFTVARLGEVKLMACGSSHSIVVTVDNEIFTWGNGTSGQLGDGNKMVRDQAVRVKLPPGLNVEGSHINVGVVNIVGVACGSRHSFIWTESGLVYGFGNNFYAQLGYDFQRADFKEHQLVPRLFQNLPSSLNISQVACGEQHTLFALEDGSVTAVQNDYGQIGIGSNENVTVPCFVECLVHVSKVTCGANHNLALTGDGSLFQWGCGRACVNTQKNILFPEEVTLPSSTVKDIAGGCWHNLLLTDGGNVFSWGMGQEGQLGLGENWIHVSTPRLLGHSQLSEVTQIQAGDSYSAAVTAGGELLLWGQIPCVSQVSDHPGLKRIWTPQLVPLAGRKVCGVACGTWHMVALTAASEEKNTECAHPETEAHFRDLVSNPLPTEHTEKENTVKDSRQVRHMLLQGPGKPEGSEEQEKDEESGSAEEEEVHKERAKGEGDEALHESAFTVARSTTGMDRTGNRYSSIKSNQGDERDGGRTAGPWELKDWCRRRGSKEVVFPTMHLLPRSEGRQFRPTASTLPRLLTRQQTHGRILTETIQDRATCLSKLVQKSGSDSSPTLGPKPKPPGRCTGPGAQTIARSSIRLYTGVESPIYSSSLHLSPEKKGPRVETSFSPTLSSSKTFRHCPKHRRVVSSSVTSWKNL
ncbi:probable E3 ubiquitin-protein ligase HERC2 isoform X4 [Scomber scombrus]